jgi:hypothetical protein
MCRVEERVYIGADGNRSKFEDTYPCDKSRNGRLCSKVKKRTTEYYPKKGVLARNNTPSPINPPTPTGTGSYLVQQVRPTSSSGRPSTRDGQKATKPAREIVIEFGPSKDRTKKYPSFSVSTKPSKRLSYGASSVASNEGAIESPGSDSVRTGFPEAPLPAQAIGYGHSDGFSHITPTTSHGFHHRNTSSTGSSRTPSLYITSDPDYDSPTTARTSRIPSTVIHNSRAPSSPSRPRIQTGGSSNNYSTHVVTPKTYAPDTHTPDGLYPLDYPEFADRSASSHASSGASGQSRRGKEQDYASRKKDDERRRQEELDHDVAEALAKEENVKQVRFELGRAESRAKERAENIIAEKDKQRAADREEARRMKEQERVDQAKRERKKEKERPKLPTIEPTTKRQTDKRRGSMTQAQIEEQRRLLAADVAHMHGESQVAEAREREEKAALLRQQQQDPSYYNPRAGNTQLNDASIGRRNSISRRGSIASTAPPAGLGLARSNSNRRPNITQPNPPAINTQVTQSYPRPPSARTHAPPPVSFPTNFNTRPPTARRPSYSAVENPFAAPPTRASGSSIDNPFAPASSVLSPSTTVPQDPWDARTLRDTLPTTTTSRATDGRHVTQRRRYETDDYAVDSSEDMETHGYGRQRY